ncbi:transglycosylase SLT domain-containing protein, partial [Streptomyces sp. 2MCAF27]
ASYTVAEVQAMARQIVPADQFQCFSNIVNHESTWNYRAENPSSGAYGLVQALPGSKMSSVGADWRTNPATQIKWGLNYMNERYDSPCGAWSFWQANNYY